jgi:predicted kinase
MTNKPTLYTLVGLPACGKSTYCMNNNDCVIVSTDAIRKELYGDESAQTNNAKVYHIAHERIALALASGKNVIFDATNINKKARKRVLKHNAYHIAVCFLISSYECKERNKKRSRHVPESVIDDYYKRMTIPSKAEGFDEVLFVYK